LKNSIRVRYGADCAKRGLPKDIASGSAHSTGI
jgi:hypothetical protein